MKSFLAMALCALAVGPAFASAAVITYDATNRPTSITDLEVPSYGTLNVAITYGATFNGLYGSGDPLETAPYFLGNAAASSAASNAIIVALNADGRVPSTPGTFGVHQAAILSVYSVSSTDCLSTVAASEFQAPYQRYGTILQPRTMALPAEFAFATFTPVPEPGAAALCLLAGGSLLRRRRKVSA